MMPTLPRPHLIVRQPRLALGPLQALLDPVLRLEHPRQLRRRRRQRRVGQQIIVLPTAVALALDSFGQYLAVAEVHGRLYLFDAQGKLVKRWVGEGSYGEIEAEIRRLLVAANPGTKLPPVSPDLSSFSVRAGAEKLCAA